MSDRHSSRRPASERDSTRTPSVRPGTQGRNTHSNSYDRERTRSHGAVGGSRHASFGGSSRTSDASGRSGRGGSGGLGRGGSGGSGRGGSGGRRSGVSEMDSSVFNFLHIREGTLAIAAPANQSQAHIRTLALVRIPAALYRWRRIWVRPQRRRVETRPPIFFLTVFHKVPP